MTVTAAPETQDLLPAVTSLRDEVGTTKLPFDLPGVHAAEGGRTELLRQLDDYILPRLASLDAPLLAVVGGSTGSGKSTLVNSLVETIVSAPGVLRPTTRSPVLVHHPDDERWFTPTRILPDLARAPAATPSRARRPCSWSRRHLPPGLALLDAPDIDSVVSANRELARQLLAAADLWLFVTTAARYADAVPWELLRQASERGTSVAMVLDRVPRGSIAGDPRAPRLDAQGAGPRRGTDLHRRRVRLAADGLLPADEVARLRSLAGRPGQGRAGRAIVVRQTLTGALDSLDPRIQALVDASAAQASGARGARKAAGRHTPKRPPAVETGMSDGSLLRGEVLARWQEFVGTGSSSARSSRRSLASVTGSSRGSRGSPPRAAQLDEALHSGVARS